MRDHVRRKGVTMSINKMSVMRIIFALIVGIASAIGIAAQGETTNVENGAKVKMKGIIAVRNADSMIIRDIASEARYHVDLMPETKVQKYKRVLRGGRD